MPLEIEGIIHLSPKEAFEEIQNGAVLVDLREDYEIVYKSFDVPNLIWLPYSTFYENYSLLPTDKNLIFADSVGLRSKEAVIFLKEKAFTNISNLIGGIVDWEQDGLPLKIDATEALTGSCACMLKPMRKIRKK